MHDLREDLFEHIRILIAHDDPSQVPCPGDYEPTFGQGEFLRLRRRGMPAYPAPLGSCHLRRNIRPP